MSGHWSSVGIDETVWLGDDPDLALVGADMDVWLEAHPCSCDGICECDGEAA